MTPESGLVAARFVHFAALTVFFGLAIFPRYAIRPEARGRFAHQTRVLLAACAALALASALAWFAFSTASMTGSLANAADPASLWLIARATEFGGIWVVRIAILAVLCAVLLLVPSQRAGAIIAFAGGVALASLAWVGHSGEGGLIHRFADAVHLLTASIWIGALGALLLLHRAARTNAEDARLLHTALVRFSGAGPLVVVLLLFTGLVNSWFLVGPENAFSFARSSYGLVLAVKLLLFVLMLLLAALNRYALTPRLARHAHAALPMLRSSLALETLFAMLVLAAVATLGTLPPPAGG